MRKIYLYIIIGVGLISCDIEFSDNGNLDGFWKLYAVDTLQTGMTGDLRENGLTWAFEGKILEVRDLKERNQDIILSFSHTDYSLKVYSPYQVDRENDDILVEDIGLLRPYGINQLEETFKVRNLNSDKMILESYMLRLYFRKY